MTNRINQQVSGPTLGDTGPVSFSSVFGSLPPKTFKATNPQESDMFAKMAEMTLGDLEGFHPVYSISKRYREALIRDAEAKETDPLDLLQRLKDMSELIGAWPHDRSLNKSMMFLRLTAGHFTKKHGSIYLASLVKMLIKVQEEFDTHGGDIIKMVKQQISALKLLYNMGILTVVDYDTGFVAIKENFKDPKLNEKFDQLLVCLEGTPEDDAADLARMRVDVELDKDHGLLGNLQDMMKGTFPPGAKLLPVS